MAILKRDVDFNDMHPSMWMVRGLVDAVTREFIDRDAIITSARRPAGARYSYHQDGLALDLRTKDMPISTQRAYAARLQEVLGSDFQVVLEGPAATNPAYLNRVAHIHIEWDIKAFEARAD